MATKKNAYRHLVIGKVVDRLSESSMGAVAAWWRKNAKGYPMTSD